MKAPCKNTWTGVRWLLLARGACGSGRLWGACAQSDGGLALSRRGHVHPRSGFGHGRLCSTAYPPSGFPLGVFLWPSSLVFLFIPLAALVSSFCVIVFVCATLFRGRRQLPQAGEVRLPRRAGVVDVVGRISSSLTSSHRKRRPRGGGWGHHGPAPSPDACFFRNENEAFRRGG